MTGLLRAMAGPGAFRLFLALMVVVSHFTRLQIGRAAVYVFFSLSGYWIAEMWTRKYRGDYRVYIVSRVWRLLPVFLLGSALGWFTFWRSGMAGALGLPEIVTSFTILGYTLASSQLNAPAWSLDIEMQFYLLAPLLIVALQRTAWAAMACLIVSLAAWKLGLAWLVLPYLVFFALGVGVSLGRWRPVAPLPIMLASAVLLVGLGCSPWRDAMLGVAQGPYSLYNPQLNVLVALALVPWAMATTAFAGSRHDGMFGDLSYIVYLIHSPILHLIDTTQGGTPHRVAMAMVVAMVISVASWAIWRAVDRPLNRRRAIWVSASLRRREAPPRTEDPSRELYGSERATRNPA